MKSFSLVAVCAVALGSFALSGCSGCAPQEEVDTDSAIPQVTCGPGTRKVGNECIGNTVSTSSNPRPLSGGNN